jgi:streptomycin 6-kinase
LCHAALTGLRVAFGGHDLVTPAPIHYRTGTMFVDPSGCAQNIIDIHGAAGIEWLKRLPDLLADCAQRWSLDVLPPFAPLSYNYVAPALRRDGTPVVVKASVPHPEFWQEMEALKRFDGKGMVRLLKADREQGVMLLERLTPGTLLSDLDDDEHVTHIAAGVMLRLWRPVEAGHPFTTVARWAAGLARLHTQFEGGYGPFPPALVERAERLFRELIGEQDEALLIHGDMHPGNILASERDGWLAIDPKGVVGPRLYDVATFVGSLPETWPVSELKHRLARRVNQLAEELELDRAGIRDWGLAQAVLSGWWSYEDHGRGWERAFAIAEILAHMADKSH